LQTLWEVIQSLLATQPRIVSAGYSHHDDADALDHDARERLHRIVGDDPGVNVAALADRAGLTRSTARYHLRVLEQTGVLASAKISGKRRYFRATGDGDGDAEWHAALRDQTTADVVEVIGREGPVSGSTLAAELDRDPSTVSHHLNRLEEAGLVERERDGRAIVNRLTDAAREALATPAARERAERSRGSAD